MTRPLEIERNPDAVHTQMLNGQDFVLAVRTLARAREQVLAGTLHRKAFLRDARKALRYVQKTLDEQRTLEDYRRRAQNDQGACPTRDGEIECDENARVSPSTDSPGAYVACWLWVPDPEPAEE